jgi:1-acyl-sn-glycerol-3-phosphate acyltransferase
MKRVVDVLRSVWIWTAGTSLIVFWIPLLSVIRLFDRDPLRLRTGRWFRRLGRALTRVNPWRLHISGRENVEPGRVYVIVSNHQSLADIPLITHLKIDAKWLAKAELFRFPGVGWMLRMAGDVSVERSDRRKGAQALLQCVRYLRKRCSLVFFPEGTRSPGGEVLEFNEGPFQLAIREQVPVLPLVVDGSGSALPRSTWIFGGTQDIYLRIMEAIPVEGLNVKQSGALRDTVRQKMIDELQKLRAGPVNPSRPATVENVPITS